MSYVLLDALVAWRKSIPALSGIFFAHVLSDDAANAPGGAPRSLISVDVDQGHSSSASTVIGFTVSEVLSLDVTADADLPKLTTNERLLIANLDEQVPPFSNDVRVYAHHYIKPETGIVEGAKSVLITWRGVGTWKR